MEIGRGGGGRLSEEDVSSLPLIHNDRHPVNDHHHHALVGKESFALPQVVTLASLPVFVEEGPSLAKASSTMIIESCGAKITITTSTWVRRDLPMIPGIRRT